MFKAINYKEWIKLRWFFFGGLALGLIVILTIFIDIRATSRFNQANTIWVYIIFKKYLFYGDFEYIPVLIGLVFGIAQFFPETNNLRLKLTLHLPVDENKILFYMISYGLILLIILYAVFVFLLSWLTITYFPKEILFSMLNTIIPWLIAGISIYFFTASVIIEPLWSRKVIVGIFGYIFIIQLLIVIGYSAYQHSYVWIIFALLLMNLIFLTGFRFKRGTK